MLQNIIKSKDTDINIGVLHFLTNRTFTYEEVAKNNKQLTKDYNFIVKSYGFNDFYDMFLYINRDTIIKGGNKDESKLNKVKRKVIRNGKEIEMTVYEDPNAGNQQQDKKPKDNEQQPKTTSAIGSKSTGTEEGQKVNPKRLSNTISKLGSNIDHIDTSLVNISREFTSTDGDLIGNALFEETEDTIKLHGYITKEDVTGVGVRSIIELLLLGIKKEKNIEVYDIQLPEAIQYLKMLGFTKKKDSFYMKKKDVLSFIGDLHEFL
ncbi:virion component [Staphylococcus phage Twort]|uniref:ORF039 n=2 Tax=Staphylococcus phage Twort (strain DSM 17442 / HER 48) TaxID=2908167 RepID=Q4Z9G8_BPTWO|nr:virion structural protein [Staphylococcus phage Twort]AAX92335.1 ORF039 [Staphylococcus phage Twort]QIW89088.1 virion component [Staphylococcus phage Twort]